MPFPFRTFSSQDKNLLGYRKQIDGAWRIVVSAERVEDEPCYSARELGSIVCLLWDVFHADWPASVLSLFFAYVA